jgi:hypothetical protein
MALTLIDLPFHSPPPFTLQVLLIFFITMSHLSQVPVTHTYNPSYSEGRNQKDCGSKSARANNSWDPISKIPITHKTKQQKKTRWSGSRCRPWVQTPILQKKRKSLISFSCFLLSIHCHFSGSSSCPHFLRYYNNPVPGACLQTF